MKTALFLVALCGAFLFVYVIVRDMLSNRDSDVDIKTLLLTVISSMMIVLPCLYYSWSMKADYGL